MRFKLEPKLHLEQIAAERSAAEVLVVSYNNPPLLRLRSPQNARRLKAHKSNTQQSQKNCHSHGKTLSATAILLLREGQQNSNEISTNKVKIPECVNECYT